ncbi:MAG: hypothetical protein JNJ57_02395 [Saprospiraceae bacterium]|nr:hypothetical protein [Saprospiraceae bacterium]
MKISLLHLYILVFTGLVSTSSMCKKDENTDPEFTSLIGYWKLKSGKTFAINSNGQEIVAATFNPGTVAHEFLSNGVYKGHDLVGGTPVETGTWELNVTKLDVKDIEEGTLSIKTPFTQAMAGDIFVDPDGSIKYSISSIEKPIGGSKPIITLQTKAYEAYPYDRAWAVYVFEKQ